jgi:Protein phosphatase 2C
MTDRSWRLAAASRVGARHLETGKVCQDSQSARVVTIANGARYLVVAVSDGAGSADCAEIGSQIATGAFVHHVTSSLDGASSERVATVLPMEALIEARRKILERAQEDGLPPRSYACTFIGVVAGPRQTVFVQVGDGAALFRERGDAAGGWRVAIAPQRGEYVNETYFLTDETALAQAELRVVDTPIDDVAVTTDGLQDQAMGLTLAEGNPGFLDPLFATLLASDPADTEMLNEALERFLDSEAANRSTDDDKTLVLASRTIASAAEEVAPP